jgi:acid phosphatase (class A)
MRRFTRSSIRFVSVALLAFGSFALAGETFLPDTAVDLVRYLAPPPPVESSANRAELAALLQLQATRTPAEVAYAQADQKISVFRFADSLDTARFKESLLPITAHFFEKTLTTANGIYGVAKKSFARPRPFVTDTAIHPVLSMPTSASYPSGHSMSSNLMAILLANIVPEKKTQIFERGWVFAEHRALGGVHYPSDLQAGRIAAALVAQRLYQDPEFRKELEASRVEIRKVLGYTK